MNKKKLLFIVNPISGGKSKKGIDAIIDKYLDSSIFSSEIIYTKHANHATQIVKEKIANVDGIVAVGGDGTINEIARELSGTNTPMGIIPMGSGNGLARFLHIPLKPEKAVKVINTATEQSIDTAVLNKCFFVSIAGVGFDSLIAAAFENTKGRGFINYARLSLKKYFKYQEQEYLLQADGVEYKRTALMISFANSNQFGYNTVISPHANISDGLLDICIVRKPMIWQIPLVLYYVWMGKANRSNLLEIIRAKNIKIRPNIHYFANVDGESIKVGKEIDIKLKPKNLIVLVPKTKL